jgi:hypothetical protein
MTRPTPALLALSLVAAVLAASTSLAGMLWPGAYARETSAWALQGVAQDAANLPLALALVWSAARLRGRGSLSALSIWLGCLAYFMYAFAIYAFGVHFGALFLAYVAVLGLAFYAFVGTLAGLDITVVTAPLRDRPSRAGASFLLFATGVLFAALWLAEDVPHVLGNAPPPSLDETGLATNPVHVLDLAIVLPAMIVTGVLLRRRRPLGLLLAPVLLVFAVAMGGAILAMFAFYAKRHLPVPMPAVVVVAAIVILSGVCAWRLWRGTASNA